MIAVFSAVMILFLWTAEAEKAVHYVPDYPKKSIEELLAKEELTKEEYDLLWRQTGLSRVGIDELFGAGRQEELLYLQERFFAPIEYSCCSSYFFYRSERVKEETGEEMSQRAASVEEAVAFLPTAHTGDILITFSGHVFGWRSGHAALVVDGEKGLTLEAITVGCNSRVCKLAHWREYPGFALLRLKGVSEPEGEAIAAYAMENLSDVPYELYHLTERSQTADFLVPGSAENVEENGKTLSGTQCAHLVWSAYRHFGYDLDSDGGRIVTPRDLYESDLLTIVQMYGIDIEE